MWRAPSDIETTYCLQCVPGPYNDEFHDNAVESYEPWLVAVVIACVGSALWMALCTLVLWVYRWRRRKLPKSAQNGISKTGKNKTDTMP